MTSKKIAVAENWVSTTFQKINRLHSITVSILNQKIDSSLYHIVLVLSEKDFLNKEKNIPIYLNKSI